MCIKDYETEIGGQGPVRVVELFKKSALNYATTAIFHRITSLVFTNHKTLCSLSY
jgi:hypothetical protein